MVELHCDQPSFPSRDRFGFIRMFEVATRHPVFACLNDNTVYQLFYFNFIFHLGPNWAITVRKSHPQVWKWALKQGIQNCNFCDKFREKHSKRLIFCRDIGENPQQALRITDQVCISKLVSQKKRLSMIFLKLTVRVSLTLYIKIGKACKERSG